MNRPPKLWELMLMIIVLMWLCLAMADGAEINRPAFLASIVAIENTPGRGANGELGPYQFTRAVWRQHSSQPFDLSTVRSKEGDRVALAHLSWLETHVDSPTPYRLALAWNGGLGAVRRNAFTDGTADYATRVRNVYEEAIK